MTLFDQLREKYPNLIPVQELRANVSITELALEWGFKLQPQKGKSRPVLEHPAYGDTIIIKNPSDPANQVYQRAGDFTDSGTVVDFVRNRLSTVFSTFNRPDHHEFRNITDVLYAYLRIDPNQQRQNRHLAQVVPDAGPKQQFARDQFDIRPLEKDNYLLKRCIAPQTIERPEFAGKVVSQVTYFDTVAGKSVNFQTAQQQTDRQYLQYKNVAFPYYNGQSTEITGLELRNEGVKLHAAGSDRFGSVYVTNPPPATANFYVMESAIDALSHRQLRAINGDDAFNSVYFSTGGQLTPQQINTIIRYVSSFNKAEGWQLNLGFDNDTSGHRFDLLFAQQLSATKFPMTPTVAGPGRLGYLLPDQPAFQPIRAELLDRLDRYNNDMQVAIGQSPADPLGQKELSNQLITVSRTGEQVALNIPETSGAMAMIARSLLELTELNQRISVRKACAKDFNEDLKREVDLSQRFAYALTDAQGTVRYNSDSANTINKTMDLVRSQSESEPGEATYRIIKRDGFGYAHPLVEQTVAQGQTIRQQVDPEFARQLTLEKGKQTQHTTQRPDLPTQQPGEIKAVNPEDRPQIGQVPKLKQGTKQITPKINH